MKNYYKYFHSVLRMAWYDVKVKLLNLTHTLVYIVQIKKITNFETKNNLWLKFSKNISKYTLLLFRVKDKMSQLKVFKKVQMNQKRYNFLQKKLLSCKKYEIKNSRYMYIKVIWLSKLLFYCGKLMVWLWWEN